MCLCLVAACLLRGGAALAQDESGAESEAARRGAAVFHAGGCYSCHTDSKNGGAPLAGGRALKTPFGVFYSPNITPDPETGIGRWSVEDLKRALHQGIAPDGSHYFPSFPYTSFTLMTDADVADLKTYLDTLAPVRQANRPHDITPPFGWRILMMPWKWLFFEPGRFEPDPERSARWNRGAYLASALAHCGECHTPRNMFGALDRELWYAGTKDGPEGALAPNITPDGSTGIGRWTESDLAYLLKSGFKPDFDNLQGVMAEAVDDSYSHLSDEDLGAIAEYVLSLPPIKHQVERRSSGGSAFD
ncbi:MAG: c-type cytochrome [Kiloniellales bacterium]